MRSVKIKEVIDALEKFAPLPLQESYDNAGLQVGLTEVEVSGALLCLDVTEKVLDEAIKLDCNLIVAHHPLIFNKLSQISDKDYVQRIIIKAIKNDVVIVAMHTNIDAAAGGVNFKIAEGVIGEFAEPLAADDFVLLLKQKFNVECVQANQLLRRPIKQVALCGGAGAFLLKTALNEGADAFVTGEMHYHDFFGYEQQIQICSIGHYQSEQFTTEVFKSIIEKQCKGVVCHITQINTNPIMYI